MVAPSSLSCEHVYFMWPRKSLLAQPARLHRKVSDVVRRAADTRRLSRRVKRKMRRGRWKPPTTNRSKEDDEDVI